MKQNRPPRRQIPVAVRREVVTRQGGVCVCGCGQTISERPKSNTHFDHEPALALRAVNEDGSDYLPRQHDPDYIDARCPASHNVKTHGSGASTAGTDIGKIKKQRRRERAPKPKRPIPSRPFPKRHRPFGNKRRQP